LEPAREHFAEQYARARVRQAELWADEIVTIADRAEGDFEVVDGKVVVNWDHVQHARLRVDARKCV
jgi:hypothetical protein